MEIEDEWNIVIWRIFTDLDRERQHSEKGRMLSIVNTKHALYIDL